MFVNVSVHITKTNNVKSCIAMKTVLRWIVWLIILVTQFPEGIFSQSVSVLVNQRATLFRNASSCENAELIKSYPTKATIATCNKHLCAPEEDFQEKIDFEDTSNNLVFKLAKYNDWGTYEFICNGKKHFVRLDVLVAENKTARPSSNITLKCFAKNAKDVTWICDGKRVLHCKKNESPSFGEGFESRVSLNEGCFEDGDCSLTLTAVSKTDSGLYRCFADDESTEGSPHAHVVYVNEDPSSPEGNHTENNVWRSVAITFILISLVLAGAFYIVCKRYRALSKAANQSTSSASSQSENEPSENHPMLESITTQHDDSQSTQITTQPVQESDNNPKSSSTVPFYTDMPDLQ